MNEQAPPASHPPGTDAQTPPQTGTLGLILFLMSLTVLFAASMVAYVLIRTTGSNAPPWGTLTIPSGLWYSTIAIALSSLTMRHASRAARLGHQPGFRTAITFTMLLGVVFLAIQGPSLWHLWQIHAAAKVNNVFLHGLALMLILLHAAHVIGGIIPLGIVTARGLAGRYGPDNHRPVRHCAMYWHFLDVVWLIMFAVLLLTA